MVLDDSDLAVEHSGVPGMKWGVRKKVESLTRGRLSGTTQQAKKPAQKSNDEHVLDMLSTLKKRLDEATTPAPRQMTDHERAEVLRHKKVTELSNDDIAFLTKRLNLEVTLSKTKAERRPSAFKKGMAAVTTIIAIGGVVGTLYKASQHPASKAAFSIISSKMASKKATVDAAAAAENLEKARKAAAAAERMYESFNSQV